MRKKAASQNCSGRIKELLGGAEKVDFCRGHIIIGGMALVRFPDENPQVRDHQAIRDFLAPFEIYSQGLNAAQPVSPSRS